MVAFVVEDGTGLSNATSYTSVSTATDHISSNIHDTTWVSSTNAVKEKVLMWATQLIDQSVDFYGTKRYEDASLRWPRTGVNDADGYPYDEDEIPIPLQKAVSELARLLVISDRTAEAASRGLRELKVDVIGLVFDKADRVTVFPPTVTALLQSVGRITTGGRSRKVIRS
jgi:hypothetical protein